MVFSRDSPETRWIEGTPFVGLIASAFHGFAGNSDHAKRAAAKSVNSTLTVGAAIAAGMLTLNPFVGGAVGGAMGSALGIGAEHAISKSIEDDEVRKEVGDASLGRFASEMAWGGASGGFGGVGSSTAKEVFRAAGIHGVKKTAAHLGARAYGDLVFVKLPQTWVLTRA